MISNYSGKNTLRYKEEESNDFTMMLGSGVAKLRGEVCEELIGDEDIQRAPANALGFADLELSEMQA